MTNELQLSSVHEKMREQIEMIDGQFTEKGWNALRLMSPSTRKYLWVSGQYDDIYGDDVSTTYHVTGWPAIESLLSGDRVVSARELRRRGQIGHRGTGLNAVYQLFRIMGVPTGGASDFVWSGRRPDQEQFDFEHNLATYSGRCYEAAVDARVEMNSSMENAVVDYATRVGNVREGFLEEFVKKLKQMSEWQKTELRILFDNLNQGIDVNVNRVDCGVVLSVDTNKALARHIHEYGFIPLVPGYGYFLPHSKPRDLSEIVSFFDIDASDVEGIFVKEENLESVDQLVGFSQGKFEVGVVNDLDHIMMKPTTDGRAVCEMRYDSATTARERYIELMFQGLIVPVNEELTFNDVLNCADNEFGATSVRPYINSNLFSEVHGRVNCNKERVDIYDVSSGFILL